MSLIVEINEGIKTAIKNKDTLRLETLRMLKSKILAADARSNLTNQQIIGLFKTYAGSLQEALEQAELAKRSDLIESLKKEILIVSEFLPKSLSYEETEILVLKAIKESGAKTKKEFGQVMKILMKLNESIDGKTAKAIAENHLT